MTKAGSSEVENLQLAHKACNSRKCAQLGFTCTPIGEDSPNKQQMLPGIGA